MRTGTGPYYPASLLSACVSVLATPNDRGEFTSEGSGDLDSQRLSPATAQEQAS